MRSTLRFLWVATRGYRLRPWHSPYLRWRVETYAGGRAEMIGFREFWRFLWRERRRLRAFLKWVVAPIGAGYAAWLSGLVQWALEQAQAFLLPPP